MIPINEFIKRSLWGPVMTERDFDLQLSRTLRGLASDHDVHFNPQELICDDPSADAVFRAAVGLLAQVGLYNLDTNRVISLGRDELMDVAESTPGECVIGGGEDAIRLKARAHDSAIPPAVVATPLKSMHYKGGVVKLFFDMALACASEPSNLGQLARSLLATLDGIGELADTPGEMIWSRAVARWMRALVEGAGKPHAYLGHTGAATVPAIMSCYGEGLLDRFNSGIPINLMPELKLNWDRLKLAYLAQEMQVPPWMGISGVLGTYSRNGPEFAILTVANMLAQLSYGHGDMAHLSAADRNGYRTTRAVLQAHSAACRAVERNIGNPFFVAPSFKNGLGTPKSIYEEVASVVASTCSGASWIWGFPCCPNGEGRQNVDLDYVLASKVSHGVAGLSRDKANELLLRILALYEPTWDVSEKGKPYSYYYDLKTLTPSSELISVYQREEDFLLRLGVLMVDHGISNDRGEGPGSGFQHAANTPC